MNQFDYEETLAMIKGEGWFVPPVVTREYATQLVTAEKRPISINNVHHMTDYAAQQRFLNSKEIYAVLRSDPLFTKIVPDEYSKGMRKWVLTVVNSYSGGELEQVSK